MERRKFKYGQLFTHNGHVYQVRKTPEWALSCKYCEQVNYCKPFACLVPDFKCASLIPLRAYLKQIK